MPLSGDGLAVKILRLQADRENLVYALGHTELSEQRRVQLQAKLLDVEDELLVLTGGLRSD